MRVIYNKQTKFVCELISRESDRVIVDTCADIIIVGLNLDANLFDNHGLPLYKIIDVDDNDMDGDCLVDENGEEYDDDNIVMVTDPLEYQTDPYLWDLYIKKLSVDMLELVRTTPSIELKPIYDASPPYKQDAIYVAMEEYYASKVPQININLSTEIYIRAAAEYFYIKEVEQRDMTADERAGFIQLITQIHNHNVAFNPMLSTSQWFIQYSEGILALSDRLRTQTFTERYYVTGR